MTIGFRAEYDWTKWQRSCKPVVLNLFAEGSQIQAYDFVRDPL